MAWHSAFVPPVHKPVVILSSNFVVSGNNCRIKSALEYSFRMHKSLTNNLDKYDNQYFTNRWHSWNCIRILSNLIQSENSGIMASAKKLSLEFKGLMAPVFTSFNDDKWVLYVYVYLIWARFYYFLSNGRIFRRWLWMSTTYTWYGANLGTTDRTEKLQSVWNRSYDRYPLTHLILKPIPNKV